MAVKDVTNGDVAAVGISSPRQVRAITINSIPGIQASSQAPDTVSVSSSEERSSQVHHHFRLRVNQAIEATNVASDAVDEIGRILGGIEGIVEQVSSDNLPAPRVAILQKEAQGLREEIVKTSQVTTSDGRKPLAGDTIRLELEETLGKALEILLPDKAKDAFGLQDIGFSTKEVILNTIAKVEEARRGIQQLRSHLDTGVNSLKTTVAALEVASQNVEASQTSVRDVDDALQLARDTKGEIRTDPKGAIGSVGDITKNATELLKT